MAKTIPQLTDATTVNAADELIVQQGGITKRATGAELAKGLNAINGTVNVKDFGAVGDGAADDRAAIQAAIDEQAARGGGAVYLPQGTYLLGPSSTVIGGRPCGLLLKNKVSLYGESMFATILKAAPNADMDVINTTRVGSVAELTVSDITIDGNETAQGVNARFNIWLSGVSGLVLQNVYSKDPGSWGIRIDVCSQVVVNNILCKHSAETNSDGIHFVDTSNVSGSGIWVDTAGDDGFIIEAINQNVANYAISGIYVKVNNGLGIPARAILLLGDPDVLSGSRIISNVSLSGCAVTQASGSGISLMGASYKNVFIQGVVEGLCSVGGMYLDPGTALYAGTLSNCKFDITTRNTSSAGITMVAANGSISNNYINATIENPGNNASGATLRGTKWSGAVSVDYNPNGDKTLFSAGVNIVDDDNALVVNCKGAGTALNLQGTAQNNTFYIGSLTDSTIRDISVPGGATGNVFIGGITTGSIVNSGGVTNKFYGTKGASTYGAVSLNLSTEADGTCLFNHGLSGTPSVVFLQSAASGQSFHHNIIGRTDTEVDVQVYNTSGGAVTSGSYTFYYSASL